MMRNSKIARLSLAARNAVRALDGAPTVRIELARTQRIDVALVRALRSGLAIEGAIVGMPIEETRVYPCEMDAYDLAGGDREEALSEEETQSIDLAGMFAHTTCRI